MFRVFTDVKIEFDFNANPSEFGDALICSDSVSPGSRITSYSRANLLEMLYAETPERFLSILSMPRTTPLTIYLDHRDFLLFLSMYLKSTLEVDDIFVMDTYYECLHHIQDTQGVSTKLNEALNIDQTEANNIVVSAPVTNYLRSAATLPTEILFAHWRSDGVGLSTLPEDLSEMARAQVVLLHDSLMAGGFIMTDRKPYTESIKAKLGELETPVDEYANFEGN